MLDGVLRRLERPERVEFFDVPAMAVSSSDVRARVRRHESIDGLVPAGVARLVAELGLYLDPVSPSRVP
jgi:nicotinate-nucleotide adenylyltransferase